MEQGNLTCALFIDLKTAFDTLPHEYLLRKLKRDGVTDITLSWFYDYLSNRNQVVYRQTIQKRKRKTPANAEVHLFSSFPINARKRPLS